MMTRYPSKRCNKCGKRKSLKSGFYVSSITVCKECIKRRVRERHNEVYETKIRRYEAARFQDPRRKAKAIQYQIDYRSREPLKYKARSAVSNAIRDGRMVRQNCRCGSSKSQAHHADYRKPLQVTWLCFPCHRKEEHGQKHVAKFSERGVALRRRRP